MLKTLSLYIYIDRIHDYMVAILACLLPIKVHNPPLNMERGDYMNSLSAMLIFSA